MSNSIENLNDSQYEALKQFRRNVSDVVTPRYTDVWLIKWLKAHNYNLKKAEQLFRGTMRLRIIYEMDSMVGDYILPEAANKYEFSSSIGIAKNGSPIRYSRFGDGDLSGFVMALNAYQICMYVSYLTEVDMALLRKENEKTGRNVSEVTYIVDMDGFSVNNFLYKSVIETGLDLVQMLQDHHPEIWGNVFIINVPGYFDKAFNIFKPIMRVNLLRKIRVSDRDSTPQLLLKYIDEDVLPEFLGGTRVDSYGDPRCSEFIKFGGKIPEEYYVRNTPPLLPTDLDVSSVWVQARSVFNHPVVIRQAPSKLHIELRTENGSIGLKMLYRKLGPDPDVIDLPASDEYLDENDPKSNVLFVSPILRVQSHIAPVDSAYVNAPWPGIYIFKFDNTYSWFTARKLIFRIREDKDSL